LPTVSNEHRAMSNQQLLMARCSQFKAALNIIKFTNLELT
jgi:hypothetical protein